MSDECELPFPDALFDRVLVVHALEETANSQRLLREIWRVSAPEAHIIIVAPNRSGLWSLWDETPFGHGRPFSRSQLKKLMKDALLEPTAWTRALYMPPFAWKVFTSAADGWERVGEVFASKLGGVNLVEGVKKVRVDPGLPERVRVVSPLGLRPVLNEKKPLA
jgi:ubiquinone/menaquinone biosynthesis C-methylase UbiE